MPAQDSSQSLLVLQEPSRDRGMQPSMISRLAPPSPSGPIVDSIPISRAVPTMVSMPMMQTRVAQQTRGANTCEDKYDERLDELDERVEALNDRMKVILSAVEVQTKILQEIKQNGTIGLKKIGQ